jgi:hypothetical protein
MALHGMGAMAAAGQTYYSVNMAVDSRPAGYVLDLEGSLKTTKFPQLFMFLNVSAALLVPTFLRPRLVQAQRIVIWLSQVRGRV